MKLENEIGTLASEVKQLTSVVQDISKKVQKILDIKEQSSKICFKCDHEAKAFIYHHGLALLSYTICISSISVITMTFHLSPLT